MKFCHPINISIESELNADKNAFYGRWVKGKPRYPQTCRFLNKTKCCDNKRKNIRFVFHDNKLNKVNVVEELKSILKNITMVLIGDSVMIQLYEGLREMMVVENTDIFNNRRITALRAGTVYIKNSTSMLNIPSSASEEVLIREINRHDIIVFNQGLHYNRGPIEEVATHFQFMGKFLHEVTKNTTKRVILVILHVHSSVVFVESPFETETTFESIFH